MGPGLWANRLQDWQVRDGRLECIETRHLPVRTVHLLTHGLAGGDAPFEMSLLVAPLPTGGDVAPSPDGAAGWLVGAGGGRMDHRSAAIVHGRHGRGAGIFAGIDAGGRLLVHDLEAAAMPAAIEPAPDAAGGPGPVRLELVGEPVADGGCRLTLTARDPAGDAVLDRTTARLPAGRLAGGLALVSHPGTADRGAAARFSFRDWTVRGAGVEHRPQGGVGPVVSTQHTLSRGVLKLTAQLVPLGAGDARTATLQVGGDGAWRTVATARIDPDSWTATFRVPGWDDGADHPVRVVYALRRRDGGPVEHAWTGTVRRDPSDRDVIVLAAFTGNHNNSHELVGGWGAGDRTLRGDWVRGMWFPHADLTGRVSRHRPDLLFFSGDQVYEGASPTFPDRRRLRLDYLYKWLLWCWAWRDLTRDTPCVVIPDDHDVYQGNLWGHGGRKASSQEQGGYVHPAEFVRMVERTQTGHLPDPADAAPVDQGIGVYFTDLLCGRVSFAILEDRKFKSGCRDDRLPPSGTRRPDHFNDPDFDTRQLDLPHLELLGPRQLAFLDRWADDWRGASLKAALSQTVFAGLATHHGRTLQYLVADLDSNGWPQSGRDRALRRLRKAFAVHVAGDQHLATLAQHGLDEHRDAVWSFCVPSVANFYPRQWLPPVEGANRPPGAPAWAGDHLDGFGNRVTVHACTNPRPSGREPRELHDGMPGYGIVRFDTDARTITFECWPRYADPGTDGQYPGWPRVVRQRDNDGRMPVAHLPELVVDGLDDPVIRVIDEPSGEIVYTLRIRGRRFRPPVYGAGPFTVEVGCPDRGRRARRESIKPGGGAIAFEF